MSSKKQNTNSVDPPNKAKGGGTQGARTKNRRRSTRNASLSNGDVDNDIKDRSNIKRGKENISKFDDHQEDLYKVNFVIFWKILRRNLILVRFQLAFTFPSQQWK